MIQITRKEKQVLRNLKAVMATEQTQTITQEMLDNLLEQDTVTNLVNKGVIEVNPDTVSPDGTMLEVTYFLTKEQLQVMDDDPEVEQAWEDFRAVRGDGSITKLYDQNREAEAASKHLEEVLFKKGRLTHMVSSDTHIWVTEDKIEFWKGKGYKEACPTAVPLDLQA